MEKEKRYLIESVMVFIGLISLGLIFTVSDFCEKTNPVLLKKEIVTACRYSHEDTSTCVERVSKTLEVK